MSRRTVAFAAGAAAVASAAALIWAAGAVDPELTALTFGEAELDRDLASVAQATYGRRVLLIDRDDAGSSWTARLLETGRSGGWKLFAGLPPGADALRTAAGRLEADAAAAFEIGDGFDDGLRARLLAFGVSEVAVHLHGGSAAGVAAAAGSVQADDTLDIRVYSSDVHSFPVQGAEPVFHAAGLGADGSLPALRPAPHLDYEDGLWGGRLTVEVARPGAYLFPWPAEGADVTVDGAPAEARALDPALPLLVLELPAGSPRVSVEYVTGGVRSKVALLGAAGLVASALTMLLALRPHPGRGHAPGTA